jgi:hypothetical protein
MMAQRNEVLATAVYEELDRTRVPHWRISQKKMLAGFAADWRLCSAFFDAGGARRPEQFKYVLLRIIDWLKYLGGYHRKPDVRRVAQECHDELRAGYEVWARSPAANRRETAQ